MKYTTVRNEKGQYIYMTKWKAFKLKIKNFFKKLFKIVTMTGLTAGILYGAFVLGAYSSPVTTYAVKEHLVPSHDFPVLDRIGGCESEGNPNSIGSHFGKNGQVRTHPNSNGTTDVGQYMINNDVWGAKATQLGYNIFTPEGNRAMAEWIYLNKGTGDWSSSAKCWQK